MERTIDMGSNDMNFKGIFSWQNLILNLILQKAMD